MSYILDALRKSDQQRQRGTTTTLHQAQTMTRAHKRPVILFYGILGVALVALGIAIGWLRPWESTQPPVVAEGSDGQPAQPAPPPAVTAPPIATSSVLEQTTPPSEPTYTEPRTAPRSKNAAPPKGKEKARSKPSVDSANAPGAAQEQKVLTLSELPLAIQQEIPPMSISVHAYSPRPKDRIVGINDRLLREGATLQPGLTLEQITLEGMVFSYKGYRFKRGR